MNAKTRSILKLCLNEFIIIFAAELLYSRLRPNRQSWVDSLAIAIISTVALVAFQDTFAHKLPDATKLESNPAIKPHATSK